MMVISTGNGVNGFMLDPVRNNPGTHFGDCIAKVFVVHVEQPMLLLVIIINFFLWQSIGEFVLTDPNMTIKERGKIYSLNEGYANLWDPAISEYVKGKKVSWRMCYTYKAGTLAMHGLDHSLLNAAEIQIWIMFFKLRFSSEIWICFLDWWIFLDIAVSNTWYLNL